ncbi:MAG: hypothetical protein DRP74_03020 [Candidatus Omnitrophota bacterium]|nr:MAG: hypothetical protein DRP74_03020 [Candidatus Omnitrophota bacterium]
MIVPMKKISVLVRVKDADSCVAGLRSLGVLHVEHQRTPSGKNISALLEDLVLINRAIAILSEIEFRSQHSCEDKAPHDWRFTAGHIIDIRKRIEQLLEYSRNLKNNISQWQAWGDFKPEEVNDLNRKNIFIRLYKIPVKEIKNISKGIIIKKIKVSGGIAYCIAISREKLELPFKEAALPKMGLKKMQEKLKEDQALLESIKKEVKKHNCYLKAFLEKRKLLEKELEFYQARNGMAEAGEIVYLAGFAPYDTVNKLVEAAKKEHWGILVSEPSENDRVPTLIRYPRWVSIIKPIFKIIEVVPGYRELDISLWFLIFFSIFFGMLIGDAAYGAIFFILTFLAQKKWQRKLKDKAIFNLFYILSLFAIIWGVLSGTFFGQAWLPGWVRPLVPALRDSLKVQSFCFFLGALHLSIAHVWRGIVKLPSLRALAEAGWIFILWTAFLLARTLILGDNFPGFGLWLLITGAALVLFFTNPRKNIIKGISHGLGNLLLNLVSNFTDIVSYIRLFAVGLATVAVADSFNKMAMEVGFGSIAAGILTAFILLLGHSLNILLGPMSILVHGVRLNVLEFCNHLDIKWSGFSYQPFRE